MTQMTIWRRAVDLQTIRTECSKDFILPDSYPDIRKILYTEGTLCPERSYIDNARFVSGGTLICKVLFSDENDELHTVAFTLEYSAASPCIEESGEAMVSAEESLAGVSTRALNPRKLGIKGKIDIIPRICYECDAGPQIAGEIDEASIEKRIKVLPYWQICRVSERSLEASEDLTLPSDASLQEIIYSHLRIGTPSCEALTGSIRFTGEAALELLYRTTDGTLRFVELPIPFHSSIDAAVTPDALCMVKLIPEALTCLPAEDATGEVHGIELDFSYSVIAWIAIPAECSAVTDCYSIATATTAEEGRVTLVDQLRKSAKQQRRMLSAPSEGLKKCMKSFAKVSVDSRERSEGKLILHCIAEVTVVGSDEQGAPKMLTMTEAFPWELEEIEDVCVFLNATADPVAEAEEIKVTLTVNTELMGWRNKEASYVTALVPAHEQAKKKRIGMTLCYPLPGEDIWEIAKRYRLPQSVLLAANTVGEGALPQVLLIPGERKAVFSKMI